MSTKDKYEARVQALMRKIEANMFNKQKNLKDAESLVNKTSLKRNDCLEELLANVKKTMNAKNMEPINTHSIEILENQLDDIMKRTEEEKNRFESILDNDPKIARLNCAEKTLDNIKAVKLIIDEKMSECNELDNLRIKASNRQKELEDDIKQLKKVDVAVKHKEVYGTDFVSKFTPQQLESYNEAKQEYDGIMNKHNEELRIVKQRTDELMNRIKQSNDTLMRLKIQHEEYLSSLKSRYDNIDETQHEIQNLTSELQSIVFKE